MIPPTLPHFNNSSVIKWLCWQIAWNYLSARGGGGGGGGKHDQTNITNQLKSLI